jgi:hypothetical protein
MRRRKDARDEQQDEIDAQGTIMDWALYHPPWREMQDDGTLGPEYGPTSPGQYDKQIGEHGQLLEAGGFWDRDQEVPRIRLPAGHEDVSEYVETHSADLPDLELEVYFATFRDGASVADAARRLSISEGSVRALMSRLRRRARGGRWL